MRQDEYMLTFGQILKKHRLSMGISSKPYARLHGICRGTLWRIETGKAEKVPISIAMDVLLSQAEHIRKATKQRIAESVSLMIAAST